MKIVIFGLSITSSWGNGHATTYRSLCKALYQRGHEILFVEKDVPWYRNHRDLRDPAFCKVHIYEDWDEEKDRVISYARDAEVVVVGSYFGDAVSASDMLFEAASAPVLFYDIDTPVTMSALRARGRSEYLTVEQVAKFDAYLSFSGGPVLKELKDKFQARSAQPLYCSVDPDAHIRTNRLPEFQCDLSYLGTYAADRQEKLMTLLNQAAQLMPSSRFLVAGPQYPAVNWAQNVRRVDHVPPNLHASFYSSSRFSLNLTRADMVAAGYSPSVRLFEAAACGATILSDRWTGMEEFLTPGSELLEVETTEEVVGILSDLSEEDRRMIGARARERILSAHTSLHRAIEFEAIVDAMYAARRGSAVEHTLEAASLSS